MEEKFKPYFYIAFILIAILLFITLFPNGLKGGLTITELTTTQLGIICFLVAVLLSGLAFFFLTNIKIKAVIILFLGLFVFIFTIILLLVPLIYNPNQSFDILFLGLIMGFASLTGIYHSVLVLFFNKKEL